MPSRPQCVCRGEFGQVAQLQWHRGVDGRLDELVDQRHEERRDEQNCQYPAQERACTSVCRRPTTTSSTAPSANNVSTTRCDRPYAENSRCADNNCSTPPFVTRRDRISHDPKAPSSESANSPNFRIIPGPLRGRRKLPTSRRPAAQPKRVGHDHAAGNHRTPTARCADAQAQRQARPKPRSARGCRSECGPLANQSDRTACGGLRRHMSDREARAASREPTVGDEGTHLAESTPFRNEVGYSISCIPGRPVGLRSGPPPHRLRSPGP
ncbi:Uncharacterised protein [Mycolicibacterium fortuitum]|uniref:Uncharacterized protein n=1 Tax=Mycolicibacterium fortuitum TaxID=1766 RepID=A0A378U6N2_MYCFO|nr:Uncharacterised protein [Mycolicibacterium fortuitum]